MNTNGLPPIVGVSKAIRKACALVERFAPTDLAILLVGPTGTGKELFARHIHVRSRRRGELVDVNCGALPREMVESLLFGHRRGAFTGAVESTEGHVQRADRGTLFLDEVLDLPLEAQVKLLRVLESGEAQRLGDGTKQRLDLRIVAAAQNDLMGRLARGGFRRDLYQRLAGVVLELPPLAERPEDVLPLATHFAARQGRVLEPDTPRALAGYSWPGNVRELRLTIQRAGLLVENGTLPPAAIQEAIALGWSTDREASDVDRSGAGTRWEEERRKLLATCVAHDWRADRIAKAYGIHRVTLFRRLRRFSLSLRMHRATADGAALL
ncbi:MAG TPA: sigma 54-interacting transcriptional regulator [Gemmatimonadales bacterium]|nr:sigma 54-interacting transcriptional regulator [Gemmatimonadales bacterium]